MLTEEQYMDVLALRRQDHRRDRGGDPAPPGDELQWLAAGGPPARRRIEAPPMIDERWADPHP